MSTTIYHANLMLEYFEARASRARTEAVFADIVAHVSKIYALDDEERAFAARVARELAQKRGWLSPSV